MVSTDWKDKVYDDIFNETMTNLQRKKAEDLGFSPLGARGILGHLYIQDGNDWGGRGELQDLQLQASIAAHEAFIAAWERELT
ncbi:MAG TPA: hypothetical protein DCG47_01540 [Spirochaetaceae bacterium]|jgi:hypothetical protein|nr:hypothetical protein [Spirochaetaceae bacterium]